MTLLPLLRRPPFHPLKRPPPHRTTSTTTPPTHTTLPTFLAHARATALSPTSTVYTGTYYEYLCLSTLRRLGFTLTRTGGRSDAGIDLLGTWALPCLPYPLRVLVQCKAHAGRVGPEWVRELEGAKAGAREGWKGEGVVGVLCGKGPATKGVREAVRRAGSGVVWVCVEDVSGGEGRVRQVLWNERVGALGVEGMGVGVRYGGGEGEAREKESVLLWKGVPWEPEVGVEKEELELKQG